MYKIPDSFMIPFIVVLCDDCGHEHAPIRTCEETVRTISLLAAKKVIEDDRIGG